MELRMLSLKSVPGACARTGIAIAMSASVACSGARNMPVSVPSAAPAPARLQATAYGLQHQNPLRLPLPKTAPAPAAEPAPGPAQSPADAVGATNASLSAGVAPAGEAPRASLPSGTTVLHIGD